MMFDIDNKITLDDSTNSYEFYSHHPFTSRFNNNDEIRIPVPEDLCIRLYDSYVYVEGRLVKLEDNKQVPATDTKFVNNGISHLFSDMRLEINGVVNDACYKPEIASTIKGLVSFNQGETIRLKNAGLCPTETSTIVDGGKFSVCLPLKILFGIAEDFKKVLVNIPIELILIRNNTDTNALICSTQEQASVIIDKLCWRVPHIIPGLREEIRITKFIEKGKDAIVAFRSSELHSYPALPNTTKHTWPIKTSTKVETPRYVILGFQTKRDGDIKKDCSKFDNCDFTNIRVYLNSDRFPYENVNNSFANNQFAILYDMST